MAELGENKTLHIASLEGWMNEAYFYDDCFPEFENQIVKVTLKEEGDGYKYGFIEFISSEVAELVLEKYRNTRMPKSNWKNFLLNWSKQKTVLPSNASEGGYPGYYNLEVAGALPNDVTTDELQRFFKTYYPSVKGAELHFSESVGLYGIVKFGKEHERDLATIQMHMQYFRGRKDGKSQHFFYKDTAAGYQRAAYPSTHLEDANSVRPTIYIQNLKKDVSERVLRDMFSCYGQITKVTLKACAVVQFSNRLSADIAVGRMNECESAPIVSSVEDFKIVRVNLFNEGDLKYGIIEFTSHEIAEKVLEKYNNEREVSAWQKVSLSWSNQKWPLQPTNVSEGVVAGDMLKDVTAEQFQRKLKIYYPSVKDAELRVSKSQGVYTIIRFAEEHERDLATVEMHMQYFRGEEDGKSQHIFYKYTASEYKTTAYQSTHPEDANSVRPTIYIQNLEKDVSEGVLRDMFSHYGPMTKVTLQRCALIQFSNRLSANKAERELKAGLILPDSKEQTDEDSPKDLKDLPHEDEGAVSAFNTFGLILPDSKEQTDEDSHKDLKDLPHEDEGAVSAFNTFGLILPDSKEQTDEDSPKDLKDLPHEDEGAVSAFNTFGLILPDSKEQTDEDSPKDLKDLPHEDEFYTCDEGSVSSYTYSTCEEEILSKAEEAEENEGKAEAK